MSSNGMTSNTTTRKPDVSQCSWSLIGLLVFVALCTTLGTLTYIQALEVNGLNIAEAASVPLFILLFGWIVFSFGTATMGFARMLKERPAVEAIPPGNEVCSRTAILMPVYNESPMCVFAGLQATIDSLRETGHADEFDVFVLSDTRDPEVWLQEERTWYQVSTQYPDGPRIYYRHRYENRSRKAGNIEDFCKRWGAGYKFMLVLDADSVMSGSTIVEMVRRMDADEELGILQVPPVPVNRMSVFARLQQFAARVYGPIFVKGLAWWAQRHGNYWGHNAIIRVEPFMKHCRLPVLPGKAPLGGEILSHDFVEAALMLRAGWKVEIADDLDGSFEECPTTFLDSVIRDQRWCQGNMQHARLTACDGFLFSSRLHFGAGVMSYVSSVLWIAFLLLTVTGAILERQTLESADTSYAVPTLALFVVSMGMLIAPKFFGLWIVATKNRPVSRFGGALQLVGSVFLEIFLSVLLAPLLAVYHARFVVSILLGTKVEWNTQQREDCGVSFPDALREHWTHTLIGLSMAVGLYFFLPALLLWFAPSYLGLIFSIPLVMILGSPTLGRRLAKGGLLTTPDETEPAPVLQRARELQRAFREKPVAAEGECLFESLYHDPDFRRLHLTVLEKTRSSVPAHEESRQRWQEAVQKGEPKNVPEDQRFAVLSDAEALHRLD